MPPLMSPLPPQGPALTLLLEEEPCWLRMLPQVLAEAEANAEIYRKGWYPGASLAAFRQWGVGGALGWPWTGP